MRKPFLTAEWRKLIMANYETEPSILKSLLPRGTELDYWNGTCYLSLVGFMFMNTKLSGISIPLHEHFEEVNLRFYVRYKEGTAWKRGVVFIREVVPRFMISFVANTIYGEKYRTLPMRHSWEAMPGGLQKVSYGWRLQDEWNRLCVTADSQPMAIQPGSEEEFITEHYWGYAQSKGRSAEYEVSHPRWQIYPVHSSDINCNTEILYGPAFLPYLSRDPRSVFLAEGSEIAVYPKREIKVK